MRYLTVVTPSKIPEFNGEEITLDLETTREETVDNLSGENTALSPYRGGEILGFSAALDKNTIMYVPLRHKGEINFPIERAYEWLRNAFKKVKRYTNHNVKFDAHYLAQEVGIDFSKITLVDVFNKAKLLSTNRFGSLPYGLTALAKDWLRLDITPYEDAIKRYLVGKKKDRDYATVPIDAMSEYANTDVYTTNRINDFINERIPEESRSVFEYEEKLTGVLFDMERIGMKVNLTELAKEHIKCSERLRLIEERIHEISGLTINPASEKDVEDLICKSWGLPIIEYTEKGKPSFTGSVLNRYCEHPEISTNKDKLQTIKFLSDYRTTSTYFSLFVDKYINLQHNEILHPNYNQCVQSGRLSCRDPNMQQLSPRAKKLSHPRNGRVFIKRDYSQIEFRLIVHYLENRACIEAYNKDPKTDFHDWVAAMCGIPRKRAKNVNFGIGFGAGENKIHSMLVSDPALIAEVSQYVRENNLPQSDYVKILGERAHEVYQKYHDTLPTLKANIRGASQVARNKGYVKTLDGRRRHIDPQLCYIGFNSVIQGTAAGIMKQAMIRMSRRYNDEAKQFDFDMVATVHDELLLEAGPGMEKDEKFNKWFNDTMSNIHFPISVPIYSSCGYSYENWADCESETNKIEV